MIFIDGKEDKESADRNVCVEPMSAKILLIAFLRIVSRRKDIEFNGCLNFLDVETLNCLNPNSSSHQRCYQP